MSFYKLDKKRHKSVTSIIGDVLGWNKKALISWSTMKAKDGLDHDVELHRRADFGTAVHKVLELYYLDKEAECKEYLLSLGEWHEKVLSVATKTAELIDSTGFEPMLVEKTIISHELKTGGTMDLVGRIGGEIWLLDYKTSSSTHKEHTIQLSAYKELLRIEEGIEVDKCGIVLASETPSIKVAKNLDAALDVFKHLVEIECLKRRVQPPK